MVDHGEREHASWAASATARNVHCPGALALALDANTPDKETIHSARGTAAHQISEKCLRSGADADSFIGKIEKTKSHEIEIDEELANSAQEYIDYCRGCLSGYEGEFGGDAIFWIEEKFSLAELGPPFDAGGTGDFVVYYPVCKVLEVVDLKNGMGVVDVKDNPQLRTYGLGAVLAHPELDVETVTVTIAQPRAPHKDGRIRSETFHVADLIAWTADLLKSMHKSKAAMDAYETAKGNSVLMDEWVAEWLQPGKCTFCPVEGTCPALRRDALSVASVWFDDMNQPRIGNMPNEMSPEKIAETLDMLPMLEDWVKAVRAYAHTQAEMGTTIPGWQLSEKIGNRRWIDADVALVELMEQGFSEDQVYDRKPISPAKADKLLGAKRKALIEPFVERPVTGTNLVSEAKTSRPPAPSTAAKYFEPNSETGE
ncbi:DUF2800 domain-containing protein [Hoeflea sp. G2-23]|uniref:DUF2800 domain-containing protein n=1 Tax=Hoeflea algicola TaxID=2983763 RepID=A0ABT3Z983_9HYPH|nr:DUF2800 domain-containing protein [Hoeflea algicola]MCY0148344.1 DUF2800 domain-containing protein [Hoeflea algicola]